MPHRPTTRTAFTLVELLVVIGIIALLLGILAPFLAQARDASKRTVCLSNLRQIGVGLTNYRDDNAGAVPEVQTLPVDPSQPGIDDALAGYLSVADIWRCPADTFLFNDVGVSYEYFLGFYLNMIDVENFDNQMRKNRMMKFFENQPSLAYIMLDAEDFHPFGPDEATKNALYLDGHVDWFSLPGGGHETHGESPEASP